MRNFVKIITISIVLFLLTACSTQQNQRNIEQDNKQIVKELNTIVKEKIVFEDIDTRVLQLVDSYIEKYSFDEKNINSRLVDAQEVHSIDEVKYLWLRISDNDHLLPSEQKEMLTDIKDIRKTPKSEYRTSYLRSAVLDDLGLTLSAEVKEGTISPSPSLDIIQWKVIDKESYATFIVDGDVLVGDKANIDFCPVGRKCVITFLPELGHGSHQVELYINGIKISEWDIELAE